MPIIKSAKKRVRTIRKASIANAKTKRAMRESIKAFQAKVNDNKDSTEAQKAAYSAIDTAYKKGIISKNKAARKKSQLNSASKAAGTTKPGTKTTKKSPTKKTAAAKTPAKKAPVKKTAAKKPTTKKTTPKKTTKK